MAQESTAAAEPIAVVGFAVRFPGDATSPQAFWDMLCQGRSARTEIPSDRFNKDAWYHRDHTRLDAVNTRHAHFMKKNFKAFDAPFFGISHDEASIMDPQQRGLLEVTYHALENGGIKLEDMAGSRTSVYTASFARDHDTLLAVDAQTHSAHQMMGTTGTMLANRISYFFDLRGPSLALDTACSSSVYAIHLACESIRRGESTASIVGGSNLMLSPESMMIPLSNAGILSPDGISYSFDHRANGYSRGEGIAVVVLKSLTRAIEDGNVIRGIIRATGVSHDGNKPSLTAPSMAAQEALMRETYAHAGLTPAKTRFIEAHGTGTQIGDSREAGTIGRVFSENRADNDPLIVGALKSNFGHLEGASGLAALVKTIYVLETGLIPPNAWFEKVNPAIAQEQLKITFPVGLMSWPENGSRQASISNYGFGGSNAHLILQDVFHCLKDRNLSGIHRTVRSPPNAIGGSIDGITAAGGADTPITASNGSVAVDPHIIILSAADDDGPYRQAEALQTYLENKPVDTLVDALYTLSERRTRLPWRSYAIRNSGTDVVPDLSTRLIRPVRPSKPLPEICFAFTGQGAQWAGMGRELMSYEPFRESLDAAEVFLSSLGSPWSLKTELLRDETSTRVHSPALSQPICTCLQIALVELLRSWSIVPSRVVGHSSGEIAAAFCAGSVSRESAWKIAYYRGLLSESLAHGKRQSAGMMAVALTAEEASAYVKEMGLDSTLFVGCLNSYDNTTMTGLECSISQLKAVLDAKGIFARKLDVGVAYHSKYMADIAEKYAELLDGIEPLEECLEDSTDRMAIFSSVTGEQISPRDMGQKEYWVRNLLSRVDFLGACNSLSESCRESVALIVEVGPHAALQRPLKANCTKQRATSSMIYVSALRRGISATISAMEVAGTVFAHGHSPDMMSVNRIDNPKTPPRVLPDLPGYPFRETQHWAESRLFESVRLRKHPRHELLGTAVSDWIPAAPRWRHIIKMKELPWTRDHAFNQQAVYPAAGMLVMAVEAVRQIADTEKQITGYRLRRVEYMKPLLISEDGDGAEAEIILMPNSGASTSGQTWYDFQIFGFKGTESTKICQGLVTAEQEPHETPRQVVDTAADRTAEDKQAHDAIQRRCTLKVHNDQLYENLEDVGFQYGDFFKLLKSIAYNKAGEATGSLRLRDYASHPHAKRVQPCVIHPTTLDSITHLQIAAICEGGWKAMPTMMASRSEEIWISNDLLTAPDETVLEASASVTFRGYREVDCVLRAIHAETKTPMVIMEGHRATATGSFEHTTVEHKRLKKLCYNIAWKPDLSLATIEEQRRYFKTLFENMEPLNVDHVDAVEALSTYFTQRTALDLPPDYSPSQPHLLEYTDWMARHIQKSSALPDSHPRGARVGEQVLAQLDPANPLLNLVATVGQNLPGILAEQVDPLELLFGGSLAADFYATGTRNVAVKMARYLDILSHSQPALKILEIGAGTGSTTREILGALTYYTGHGDTAPRFAEYVYTDISPAFFENARAEFASVAAHMRFRKLDISRSPEAQEFDLGSFDVVIAGSVLHATSNLHQSLSHIAQLLRPGGKLLLSEQTNMSRAADSFVFGVLAGWWLSEEDWRKETPLVSEETWNGLFQQAGFSGTDLCFRDSEDDESYNLSAMVTTLSASSKYTNGVAPPPPILLVIDPASNIQATVARHLEEAVLASSGSKCQSTVLSEAPTFDLPSSIVIFLAGLDRDLLDDITASDFAAVKSVCTQARQLLWVTQGAGDVPQNPNMAKVLGLSRTVCSERGQQAFSVLDVDPSSTSDRVADLALLSMRSSLAGHGPGHSMDQETEYLEKDGLLHVGRVVPEGATNDKIHPILSEDNLPTCRLESPTKKPVHLTIESPGILESLKYIEEDPTGILGDDEVEVEVQAASIGLRDVAVALGNLPGSYLGSGASGVVVRAGTRAQVNPGDRVVCQTNGSLRTYLRCHTSEMCAMPAHLSFGEAAGMVTAFNTAHYALLTVGRVRKGDTMLIHSGAGAVGQAALQIAQLMGVTALVMVDTMEEKHRLEKRYHIPEHHVLLEPSSSLVPAIRRVLGGRGVDVILSSHAGDLQVSAESLEPFGRCIDLSKHDPAAGHSVSMQASSHNMTYSSVDLDAVSEHSKPLLKKIMSECVALLNDQPEALRAPYPLQVYRASQVKNAFRTLQTGGAMGSIVITFAPDDEIQYRPKPRRPYKLSGDATYVVAGGLGGLGRSIVGWMASKGARHFLIPTRQEASDRPGVQAFIDEIKQLGGRVEVPVCDISDAAALRRTVQGLEKSMPPIKGCFQATMIIRDALFESLTVDQLHTSMAPKVAGTWNLHDCLPKGLDFFIMLSSMAGVVGNRGQSNYAVGNVFQDAFARYRVADGEKATALNLGLMLGVGYAAENAEITKSMVAAGSTGITEDQLLAMLDVLCDPTRPLARPEDAQILIGPDTPDTVRRNGREMLVHLSKPLFGNLHHVLESHTAVSGAAEDQTEYLALVREASSLDEATDAAVAAFVAKLARTLGVAEGEIDANNPPYKIGVDSLLAVEVRFWLLKQFQVEVAVFEILQDASIIKICREVASQVRGEDA